MTAEEMFDDLYQKYGDNCNWKMIPLTDNYFVAELEKQIGKQNAVFINGIYAVAQCDLCNDVLFLICRDSRGDVYRIYDLAHSNQNCEIYKEFVGLQPVKKYIEKHYIIK